jgi:hypothetical protein
VEEELGAVESGGFWLCSVHFLFFRAIAFCFVFWIDFLNFWIGFLFHYLLGVKQPIFGI